MAWSLTRAHSRKRPAPVTTTFSNSRGGRLRELRLYLFPLIPHWNYTISGIPHKRSKNHRLPCLTEAQQLYRVSFLVLPTLPRQTYQWIYQWILRKITKQNKGCV